MATSSTSSADGLLLYYYDRSSCSKRVRLALALKGLSYEKRKVSLPTQENLEPWFIRLNPLGQVPVLVHNGKVIIDSSRIIDYVDTVFHDRGPILAPPEDTDLGRRVRHFRNLLEDLPVALYTFRTAYCPDTTEDFVAPEILRKIGLNYVSPATVQRLQELAAMHPDLAEAYTTKANRAKQATGKWQDRGVIENALDDLEKALDEVEKELQERKREEEASGKQQWLCGESFTAADIVLSYLLHRLQAVGLAHRSTQKRPLLNAYYLQAQEFGPYKAEVVETTEVTQVDPNLVPK